MDWTKTSWMKTDWTKMNWTKSSILMQENGKKSRRLYVIPTDSETFLHMEYIWYLKIRDLSNITQRKITLSWMFL